MSSGIGSEGRISRAKAWLRFSVGLLMLAALFGFFASGYSAPGVFGQVLRHNQQCQIDASPLIYTDVEHFSVLEEGVRQMRMQARERKLFQKKEANQ